MKTFFLAALVGLLVSASVAGTGGPKGNGGDIMIASEGESSYLIMISENASPVVSYAAKELQHFISEISGATLRIVGESHAGRQPGFVVGPCKRSAGPDVREKLGKLGEDGVLIRTAGEDVILLGRNDRGQLYSVYVLLERYFGVRFLARDCTIIPKQDRLALPEIDYAYAPPFMYRETLYFDSFPREIATRQRLNGPRSECEAEVGGKIRIEPYVHSFSKLVPPDKYFAEHPEYFGLIKGSRTNLTIHGQICLTNPDVLRIATEQVLKWIEENPDVPIFDVSQNDGEGACECEKCMAVVNEEGSQHGPILRFVNAIADEVGKKYPDKWIETLAYAYSTKPPAITKPRKNVIIRLCHAGCYFHGFEQCGLGANLAANLSEWSKLTESIFIWHYATNFAHYIAPCQNLSGLAKDIRYYASHNVRGLMVQCDYESPGGDLAELRQYLAAQLMWDPSRDPEAIRREFCEGYYGAAAGDVLRYVKLMDKAAEDPKVHAFGAWDPKGTVSPAFVADGLKLLKKARSKKLSPEEVNRVDRLFLPLWYMQLTYPAEYGLGSDGASLVHDFRRIMQASKITRIREGGDIEPWLAEMESKYPPPQVVVEITRDDLLDHIRGGWTGMLIGGLEGLPHENKYIDRPRDTLPDFAMLSEGPRTDDDNDVEWTHLYYMDKSGVLKIPYDKIVGIWKENMNKGVWCANREARKLMDEGIVPPDTGDPARNSYASFNLSGQFCVEAYGMVAPGMPNTAADFGLHYARIAVSGEPLQATRYWTTLISRMPFSKQSVRVEVQEALRAVDPSSAMAEAIRDAIKAYEDNPKDWQAARQIIHQKWMVERKWNGNSTPLNGAVVVLALLYGDSDFYRTLQYAMAMGYDADCNAATAGAVIGSRIGFKRIEALPQFKMPDTFRNLTRPSLPENTTVSEQAEMLIRVCDHVILQNGGGHINVNGHPGYRIVLQEPHAWGSRWHQV